MTAEDLVQYLHDLDLWVTNQTERRSINHLNIADLYRRLAMFIYSSIGLQVRKSAYYVSTNYLARTNSVIIPEIVGCNLSFFTAHRGAGTVLGGSAGVPTDWNVQVIPETGEVIFLYDFTEFPETLWFDYVINSGVTPPIPEGDLFNNHIFQASGTLDANTIYKLT